MITAPPSQNRKAIVLALITIAAGGRPEAGERDEKSGWLGLVHGAGADLLHAIRFR